MLRTPAAVLLGSFLVLGCASSEDVRPHLSGQAGSGGGAAGNGGPSERGGTAGMESGTAGAGFTGTAGAGGSGSGGSAGNSAADSTGAAGVAGSEGGGAGGRTPDPTATFTKIYETIVPQCAGRGCHTTRPYAGGFNFSTRANAYKSWSDNVFPGYGEGSPMFQVLNYGFMPKDRPSVTVEELFLVLDWINLGAKDD